MDYIIIAFLVLVMFVAIRNSLKHFRGGCCGGGDTAIREKKVLSQPKLGEKRMTIEGMHCRNCEIRVENALNRIDCVSAKVKWRRKEAIVSYSREVDDEILRRAVANLGYKVISIR